jgi:hypothetical protein
LAISLLHVPDPHADPRESSDRFRWLARLICDLKPDKTVCAGDWFNFESLCFQIKGKRAYEGLRYQADLDAGHEALAVFQEEIDKYNSGRKKKYIPDLSITLGNHDNRPDREVENNPILQGTIGTAKDCRFGDYGWKAIPYLQPLIIENTVFQHYITSGRMNKAIGGENQARLTLSKSFMSTMSGHSHIRDMAFKCDATGKEKFSMITGCYFESDTDYAGERENKYWWRGVVLLEDLEDGQVDSFRYIGMKKIKKEYA